MTKIQFYLYKNSEILRILESKLAKNTKVRGVAKARVPIYLRIGIHPRFLIQFLTFISSKMF